MIADIDRRLLKLVSKTPSFEEVAKLIPKEGDNKNYKKYVLFGHQRCGSSVLTSGLKSHGRIKSFAELFTPNLITFNYNGYDNLSIPLIKFRDSHPVEFLEKVIFNGQTQDTDAVGFKVFPDQITNTRFQPVWDWLIDNEDVSLIMLNRDNSLETLCSVTIAKKTGVWGIKDVANRPTLQIKLSPKECESFFVKREMYADLVRSKLKGRDVLEISYETFSSDIPKYLLACQDHMGLEPRDLPVNDIKKEVRPLEQIISNYNELENYFLKTKWKSFFG